MYVDVCWNWIKMYRTTNLSEVLTAEANLSDNVIVPHFVESFLFIKRLGIPTFSDFVESFLFIKRLGIPTFSDTLIS